MPGPTIIPGAWVDLAAIKQWLGIDSGNTADDALLTQLAVDITFDAERYLGRSLPTATYDERYDGKGGTVLALRNFPITAVSLFAINEFAVPAAGNSIGSGYQIAQDGPNNRICLYGFWLDPGIQNIRVQYTAGYALDARGIPVPSDVYRAIIMQVAALYRERTRIGLRSETTAQQSQSYIVGDWLPSVEKALRRHRRMVVG